MKNMFAFTVAAILASTFVFSGCEKKEPTLGEKMDKAVEATKDATTKTVDAAKETIKDTAKAVEDAAK